MTDHRVIHLWDQQDLLGNWFVNQLPSYQGSTWDAYLLFDKEAKWTSQFPTLVSSGSSVIDQKDALAQSIFPILEG